MEILLVVASHAVYGLIAWGVVVLLRRVGALPRTRVLMGFLVAGVVAGLAAMLAWPADAAVLLNLPGVLLGDLAYTWSISLFGEPSSAQAYYTTPYPGCFGFLRCTCLSQSWSMALSAPSCRSS